MEIVDKSKNMNIKLKEINMDDIDYKKQLVVNKCVYYYKIGHVLALDIRLLLDINLFCAP
mgnify:CR=1 FL=1